MSCKSVYQLDGDFDTQVECLRPRHLFGWHEGFLSLQRGRSMFETTISWRHTLRGWLSRKPFGGSVDWGTLVEEAKGGYLTIRSGRVVRRSPVSSEETT